MDVLHERCAGIDISKRDAEVCVRSPSPRRKGTSTTFGATTNAILDLRNYLFEAHVTLFVMKATGDCCTGNAIHTSSPSAACAARSRE